MPDALEIWLRRLRDPDPTTRREAIRQLEFIGDSAALGPLAQVFALDTDLELRRLAQAAGKNIYRAIVRREAQTEAASEAERRAAAEILAKAHAKRKQHD